MVDVKLYDLFYKFFSYLFYNDFFHLFIFYFDLHFQMIGIVPSITFTNIYIE